MRYHLDTIPVWDALKKNTECMFCTLRAQAEERAVEKFLGESVMEPDTRIRVNAQGFCGRHQAALYAGGHRLGHALMLHTHLLEEQKRLTKALAALRQQAGDLAASGLTEIPTGKHRQKREKLLQSAAALRQQAQSCVICDTVAESMGHWLHTFFHLYKTDAEFRRVLADGKGFCLPDLGLLIETAAKELHGKALAEFVELLTERTAINLQRIEGDLAWLIRKYDYRFDAEPWHNSRDAVERTANKLNGRCIGSEQKEG